MWFRDARLPIILVALLLAGVTVWSLHRFRRYQPLAELTARAVPSALDNISLQIQSATVTGRENGLRRWRVSCRAITFSRDRRQVTVDGIEDGLFFGTDQHAVASVRAGHASYSTRFGDLIESQTATGGMLRLFGGIEATVPARSHFRIQSDSLNWDALQNQIECPGQISAWMIGGNVTARDVTVDVRSGDLTLRDLHGTFLIPAEVLGIMRRNPSPHTVLALGGALALTGAAPAAPSTTPQYVTYDAGFSRWLNAPRTVEMSQGVTFSQDDAFLKTEAAVVNLDDQQRALNAKSQSPVHLYNSQDDLTGKQGYIDFTRHLATLTDNIVLIIKPGPQEKNAPAGSLHGRFQDPATLTCAQMTYDYRHKIGHVPGALTVTQKDRVLTADSGEYDTVAQTVTLIGNVHGHNGEDEIQAPRVVFGLQEGAETITIPVPMHGRWRVKEDDQDQSAPAVPAANPTAKGVAPPTPSPPATTPPAPNTPPAAKS